MAEQSATQRRRQFCARCGQVMFEYFRSPDGHFGIVNLPAPKPGKKSIEIRCPTCDARYRLLERVNAMGQPVERK
jgi:hypothetical protein